MTGTWDRWGQVGGDGALSRLGLSCQLCSLTHPLTHSFAHSPTRPLARPLDTQMHTSTVAHCAHFRR